MNRAFHILAVFLLFCALAPAQAADLYIYPAQGQSKDQQEQDEYQCYGWAKDESGFDPMAPPEASAPPPKKQRKRGGALRGAVRGAAIGEIVGDDWEDGAKAGAAIGGMRRRAQLEQEAKAQEQYQQQESAKYQANRDNYNRAYAACLTARGYTVQ